MPLIITPRQFIQRAQFYRQLGQLLTAGIPIINALDMLVRNPPARSYRAPIREILSQLSQGATFTDALRSLGRWIPSFDLALIQAGEQSGRMDVVLKLLANYYDDRAKLLRQVISDLLYPVFLFHFAIFLFPFIQWFSSTLSVAKLLMETVGVLLPIYLAVALIIFASQGRRGPKWRAIFETILRPVPILGSARHCLALARLSAALEALITAGVTIIEAWEMAAAASGSPALVRTVRAWKPEVIAGKTPAEAVNSAPWQFPEVFANLYRNGEVSGQLDDSLRRLHEYYQEEGTRKLHLFATWVPKLIYLGVAGFVAFKVIGFYVGYFHQIDDIMK